MKLTKLLLFIPICILTALPLTAEDEPVPPQQMEIPFETAWATMQELLAANEIQVISENRGQGYIKTGFKEYASGLLTKSHLEKIAVDTETSDGSYDKV